MIYLLIIIGWWADCYTGNVCIALCLAVFACTELEITFYPSRKDKDDDEGNGPPAPCTPGT